MQLYLIRHTTPDLEKGICYGQADIPINQQLFEAELVSIKSKITTDPEMFYSSPLKRCQQLAQQLSPTVATDGRLKELNFGDWELKKWAEIDGAALDYWMNDFVNQPASGGESYRDLHRRTESFIHFLLQQPYNTAGIVCHAGNIRSFISSVLELPLENSFRINVPYGAVLKVEIHENKQLNKLNLIL